MIIGHTPMLSGYILSRCKMQLTEGGPSEPRVYVIDLGISEMYPIDAKGLLEIYKDRESGDVTVSGVYFEGTRVLNK